MPCFPCRLDFRIFVLNEEQTLEKVFPYCIRQILNFHVKTTILSHFYDNEHKFSPHATSLEGRSYTSLISLYPPTPQLCRGPVHSRSSVPVCPVVRDTWPNLELIESQGKMQNFRKLLRQGLLPLQVLGWRVGWTGQRF